ncbi:MAG: hypothetical protein FJZ63_00325 [Chlamydiae bacterium]|nr:hypothetical protein [Chlamydiota bacterium]
MSHVTKADKNPFVVEEASQAASESTVDGKAQTVAKRRCSEICDQEGVRDLRPRVSITFPACILNKLSFFESTTLIFYRKISTAQLIKATDQISPEEAVVILENLHQSLLMTEECTYAPEFLIRLAHKLPQQYILDLMEKLQGQFERQPHLWLALVDALAPKDILKAAAYLPYPISQPIPQPTFYGEDFLKVVKELYLKLVEETPPQDLVQLLQMLDLGRQTNDGLLIWMHLDDAIKEVFFQRLPEQDLSGIHPESLPQTIWDDLARVGPLLSTWDQNKLLLPNVVRAIGARPSLWQSWLDRIPKEKLLSAIKAMPISMRQDRAFMLSVIRKLPDNSSWIKVVRDSKEGGVNLHPDVWGLLLERAGQQTLSRDIQEMVFSGAIPSTIISNSSCFFKILPTVLASSDIVIIHFIRQCFESTGSSMECWVPFINALTSAKALKYCLELAFRLGPSSDYVAPVLKRWLSDVRSRFNCIYTVLQEIGKNYGSCSRSIIKQYLDEVLPYSFADSNFFLPQQHQNIILVSYNEIGGIIAALSDALEVPEELLQERFDQVVGQHDYQIQWDRLYDVCHLEERGVDRSRKQEILTIVQEEGEKVLKKIVSRLRNRT